MIYYYLLSSGDPFRASVIVARDSPITLGTLFINIKHGNTSTIFEINCKYVIFFFIILINNYYLVLINGENGNLLKV